MFKKILLLTLATGAIISCDVKQTQETELPEIDIEAEAGQLPEFEVDWVDVDINTRTTTVEVPKVVVVMEEVEVEVPYIDVDMPNAGEKEERTILVEAEVTDVEHSLEIQEIWATGNRLHVISKLEKGSQSLNDQKMRLSDQVTLNAPDLDVKHYIIGERPDRVFNTQHTFVKNMADLKARIKDYKLVYSR